MKLSENPLESISDTLTLYCRDLSLDQRDAWIYGIVVGWDTAGMNEVIKRHNWDHETVSRLNRLHLKYKMVANDIGGKITDQMIEEINSVVAGYGCILSDDSCKQIISIAREHDKSNN